MPSLRLALVAALAVATTAVAAAPAHAQLASDNVERLGHLPEAAGAIGARFSPDGDTMYVTTPAGLLTYDVSRPASPRRLALLPLPHFENEDVDVGSDLLLVSNDPSFTEVGLLYVIDVSDPAAPRIRSTLPTSAPLATGEAATGNGHIADCIQDCRYAWTTGTEEGITVYDLRDPDAPRYAGRFTLPVPRERAGEPAEEGGFTHDVDVDPSGIAWVTGEDGTFGYTTDDPVRPRLVFRSDDRITNSGDSGPSTDDPSDANAGPLDFLHHNLKRTSLRQAPPATQPRPGVTPQPGGRAPTRRAPRARVRSRCNRLASPGRRARCLDREARRTERRCRRVRSASRRRACRSRARKLRREARRMARAARRSRAVVPARQDGLGDVLAVTEEDYVRPGCEGQGSLQTWQIRPGERNADGTTRLRLLDTWTTELNDLVATEGRSPATVNCSAHWFDEDRGLLAQGWYDQGVRFLDISDPTSIRQVGYWVTPGTFWAAYFAPADRKREIVYGLDTAGGIDVLRIDRARAPGRMRRVSAPVLDRWVAGGDARRYRPSPVFGLACPLPSA